MNKSEALQTLDDIKESLVAGLPMELVHDIAPRIRRLINGTKKHIEAIYDKEMYVGAELWPDEEFVGNEDYDFHMKGIQRHIATCYSLVEQLPT